MSKFVESISRFADDKTGVTALEYGIIASILGLVLVGIFSTFGSTLSTLFTGVGSSI
jgi:pilus assembly protein Flp/PilA